MCEKVTIFYKSETFKKPWLCQRTDTILRDWLECGWVGCCKIIATGANK